ncbi:WD40-repeat-containing domain protein [Naematelia encephala]|uniref:WD40-repeat-containing domain protein n=1 Tax=Naematelia encephala TaxID=71784 RepID=A0A1Y2AFG8_9TREE|nr:WD40-repeat-containing domain protein [Naematelia encephala]
MPDSFFQSEKKRKRPSSSRPRQTTRQASKPKRADRDEDLSSGSEAGGADLDTMDFRAGREDGPLSDDEIVDRNETAAEKRVRMAEGYLRKVQEEIEADREHGDYDAADLDREIIASRLQKDVAESEGRIHQYIASHIASSSSRIMTTPSHAPTSIAATAKAIFISTKRGQIYRYSLPDLKRVGKPFGPARVSGPKVAGASQGHIGEILCLAVSEDGRYLVSGGRDKIVGVWDVESDEAIWKAGIRGHKDAVSSISIPPLNNPSYHMVTASLSRHLALSSISTLSTIDTFFGHQDSITSVSSLKPTIAVTAGSRDRTCRWWKVEEEVQLVFRGGGRTFEGAAGLAPEIPKERLGGGFMPGEEPTTESKADKKGKGREFVEGRIDCVCMLDDQHFISGGDSGSISLWHTGKKKPIFTKALAHGFDELLVESEHSMPGARWITSLASLRGTDLFASGSWDGSIKLWALDPSFRSFKPASVHEIHVAGFVNALEILSVPSTSMDSSSWTQSSVSDAPEDTEGSAKSKTEILLVAAVSQEPRLGRWMRIKDGVKNGAFAAHIKLDAEGRSLL